VYLANRLTNILKKAQKGDYIYIVGCTPWVDLAGIYTGSIYSERLERRLYLVLLDDGRLVSVVSPSQLRVLSDVNVNNPLT
jgi:hypothetical protein